MFMLLYQLHKNKTCSIKGQPAQMMGVGRKGWRRRRDEIATTGKLAGEYTAGLADGQRQNRHSCESVLPCPVALCRLISHVGVLCI